MADFGIFDSFLDSVIAVDSTAKIVYCNEPAATLLQTSVRRIVNKVAIHELIEFVDVQLPLNENSPGWNFPSPYVETAFRLLKASKTGKLQVIIHPIGEGEERRWIVVGHDVTLEEVLHTKYRSELSQKEGYISELEEARRQLEDYSKNLEKLVEQRTAELRRVNENLNAVLNSLGQGFLTFDSAGHSGNVFTRACLDILETNPQGKNVADVLKIPPEKRGEFEMWLQALFLETLPFEDLKPLGPTQFSHSKGRFVTVDYYPIRKENKLKDIVMVATDKTAEHRAQIELEQERQRASMILKFVKNKDQFLGFLQAARGMIEKACAAADNEMDAEAVADSFRLLHTLEGEAGTFSILPLRRAARECQQVLEFHRGKGVLPTEVRGLFRKSLDRLHDEYGRFLNDNSILFRLPNSGVERLVELEVSQLRNFGEWMRRNGASDSIIRNFRNRFLREPVSKRLYLYDGLLENIAEKLGKKVKPLKIVGGDVLIHPEPYAGVFAALVHVFRNAIDHGIESPDDRQCVEKDQAGQVSVRFEEVAGWYRLIIQDDGQGIDPNAIRMRLSKTHPEVDFSRQSDDEVIQNIFLPGFSIRETVGEFSGRGVGMDALRDEVVKLGGSVKVYSMPAQGTKFVLEFPKVREEQEKARSA